MFVKINSNKVNNLKTFEFENFLHSLEIIATKLFFDKSLNESLVILVENYVLKLLEDK